MIGAIMGKQIDPASEREALKAEIREAHELLKDLRTIQREIGRQIIQARLHFKEELQGFIKAQIQEGLRSYRDEVNAGIAEVRKQIQIEKQHVEDIVLGNADGVDMEILAKAIRAVQFLDTLKEDSVGQVIISKTKPSSNLPWLQF